MKHYRRSFSLLLLLLAVLAGCSQRSYPGAETTDIGPEGGTVSIPGPLGNATFFFPPGVLTETTTIEAALVEETLPSPGNNISIVGPSYFVGPPCLVQGERIVPGGEIFITLPFTDDAIPPGFQEDDLTILFFDKGTEIWSVVPSTVNQNTNTVQGSFGTACIFAVGAQLNGGNNFDIDFNAIPTTIAEGGNTELRWEVTSRTGNDIQTITILDGRNGDGNVIEVFDDLDGTTVTGTLDILGLTETTEYTLSVTDGTNTQNDSVTVNVLSRPEIAFDSSDRFEYPVPQVDRAETATFSVTEGTLTYRLDISDPDVISIDEADLTGTVGEGETEDINFTVTCSEPVQATIDIEADPFGVLDTINVSCFLPPGTLRITANFPDGVPSLGATAIVQGNDNNVNRQVSLSNGAPVSIEVPQGGYTVIYSSIDDTDGARYEPNQPNAGVFVTSSQTTDISVVYNEVDTP